MNLIEELGGYSESKIMLETLDNSDYAIDHAYAHELRSELLEYRRASNIFETGDKIIYPWIGNEICTYNSECIVKTPCIHATDEEIKVGHRLPSVEVLRDCDIPPCTIILER